MKRMYQRVAAGVAAGAIATVGLGSLNVASAADVPQTLADASTGSANIATGSAGVNKGIQDAYKTASPVPGSIEKVLNLPSASLEYIGGGGTIGTLLKVPGLVVKFANDSFKLVAGISDNLATSADLSSGSLKWVAGGDMPDVGSSALSKKIGSTDLTKPLAAAFDKAVDDLAVNAEKVIPLKFHTAKPAPAAGATTP